MGGPMAQNLIKDGHDVKAFDIVGQTLSRVVNAGAVKASSPGDVASGVDASAIGGGYDFGFGLLL